MLATEPSTTKPLRDGLAGIRARLRERRQRRAQPSTVSKPASLSADDSEFLREIGAL